MLHVQVGIIPARYASQRFPGKPLALIAGVPMIVRTYQQVQRCRLMIAELHTLPCD